MARRDGVAEDLPAVLQCPVRRLDSSPGFDAANGGQQFGARMSRTGRASIQGKTSISKRRMVLAAWPGVPERYIRIGAQGNEAFLTGYPEAQTPPLATLGLISR